MKKDKTVRSQKSEVRSPKSEAIPEFISSELDSSLLKLSTSDFGLRTSDSVVCAVIAKESIKDARAAIRQAATVADLIELRLDYLRDFDFRKVENLRALLEYKPLPVIITCRAVGEGGRQQVDDGIRLPLLIEGARQMADYCDIEAAVFDEAAKLAPDFSRLIVSYHNFEETPSDLNNIYEKLIALPAAVHKIAVSAHRITDSLKVLRLIERANCEGRKLIAIAMEEAGLITRILGPAMGSFLTYGTLGQMTAPGQISCEQLKNLYRANQITRATGVTGIIGSPVAHSASPAMHNRAFAALGLDYVYLPLKVDDARAFFEGFIKTETRDVDLNFRGLSVTIPHKTAVIDLLDEVDESARRVGAVNTVVVKENRLAGYNTDAQGAMQPLEKIIALENTSCAVIGAGGAARAVVAGLKERGARVSVFARNREKARPLAEAFGVHVFPIESFPSSDAGIVINTTPAGMRGHSEGESPVPRSSLRGRKVAYDLVYNPLETRFLKDARAEGCAIVDGLEMLVAQAALQFELWTGKKAPVGLMRDAALEHLRND